MKYIPASLRSGRVPINKTGVGSNPPNRCSAVLKLLMQFLPMLKILEIK
jgi:hypothetical protein